MTSGADDAELSRWLIEPPAAKEIRVSIRIGDEAQLTPEVVAALDQLTKVLESGGEVSGFCGAFQTKPCAAFSTCTGLDPDCPSYTIQCQISPCMIQCITLNAVRTA
jgi:hypothetical protein